MVLAEKPAVLLSVSGCVTTKYYVSCEFFVTRRNSPYHGISRPRNGRAALRSASPPSGANRSSVLSEAVAKKLNWLSISSRPVRRIFAGLNAPLKTNPYRTQCAARSTNRDDIKKGKKPCPTLLRPREARRPHNGSPPRSLN